VKGSGLPKRRGKKVESIAQMEFGANDMHQEIAETFGNGRAEMSPGLGGVGSTALVGLE
jgi:hypothetical protein